MNDPYVLERLAEIAYAVLLTSTSPDSGAVGSLLTALRTAVLDHEDVIPNVLTRDAVRGAHEWALRAGLIRQSCYEAVLPPYGSSIPTRPRTLKQLEKAYERRGSPRKPASRDDGYLTLFASIFSMGDFGRYVIESKTSRFTSYSLARPLPPAPRWRQPKVSQKALDAFTAALSEEQRAIAAEEDADAFIGSLTSDQQSELSAILHPRPVRRADTKRQYPAELAQRWVFERVISLGWSPDWFGAFDAHHVPRDASRTRHKAERFGKKYQWIAVRELVARLADNFHMREEFGDAPRGYEGPWQFFGRDIDPTLPAPGRERDDDDDEIRLKATAFVGDGLETWSLPQPLAPGGPPAPDDWATLAGDVPEFSDLIRRRDSSRTDWVVLHAYYNWEETVPDGEDRWSHRRRQVWSHIYSWLVPDEDCTRLTSYLGGRSLMNRWMPEGVQVIDDAYVGETPWAAAANEYPAAWREVEPRGGKVPPNLSVYPTWSEYTWEGNVWDCSLTDSVSVQMPPEASVGDLGRARGKHQTESSLRSIVRLRATACYLPESLG